MTDNLKYGKRLPVKSSYTADFTEHSYWYPAPGRNFVAEGASGTVALNLPSGNNPIEISSGRDLLDYIEGLVNDMEFTNPAPKGLHTPEDNALALKLLKEVLTKTVPLFELDDFESGDVTGTMSLFIDGVYSGREAQDLYGDSPTIKRDGEWYAELAVENPKKITYFPYIEGVIIYDLWLVDAPGTGIHILLTTDELEEAAYYSPDDEDDEAEDAELLEVDDEDLDELSPDYRDQLADNIDKVLGNAQDDLLARLRDRTKRYRA